MSTLRKALCLVLFVLSFHLAVPPEAAADEKGPGEPGKKPAAKKIAGEPKGSAAPKPAEKEPTAPKPASKEKEPTAPKSAGKPKRETGSKAPVTKQQPVPPKSGAEQGTSEEEAGEKIAIGETTSKTSK